MEKNSQEKLIGKVTHYYDKIGVAIIKLSGAVAVGDEIHVCGNSTDFSQAVDSMQVEHKEITKAKKGDEIGIKVSEKAREGDEVYLK